MKRTWAAVIGAVGLWSASNLAQAGVDFSVGIGVPVYTAPAYVPPPVYAAPPVYTAAPAVVYPAWGDDDDQGNDEEYRHRRHEWRERQHEWREHHWHDHDD